MNRHRQLQATFAENCRMIAACKGRVEWVIVNIRRGADTAGPCPTDEWAASDELIRTAGADLIRRGWLVYQTAVLSSYHQAVCKNLAARVASGSFLINLDIDNRISIADTVRLLSLGSELERVVYHGWDGRWGTGTSGMLGVPRQIYRAIGGYNEELLPYGYEEYDLMNRIRAFSPCIQKLQFCTRTSIPNTDAERRQHLSSDLTLQELNRANRATSVENITAGRLVCTPIHSSSVVLSGVGPLQLSADRTENAPHRPPNKEKND